MLNEGRAGYMGMGCEAKYFTIWRGPIIFHPGLWFSQLSFTLHALKSPHIDTGQHRRIITVVYNQSPVYYLWLYLLSNCHLVVRNT